MRRQPPCTSFFLNCSCSLSACLSHPVCRCLCRCRCRQVCQGVGAIGDLAGLEDEDFEVSKPSPRTPACLPSHRFFVVKSVNSAGDRFGERPGAFDQSKMGTDDLRDCPSSHTGVLGRVFVCASNIEG